jgi:peroxiredoxin
MTARVFTLIATLFAACSAVNGFAPNVKGNTFLTSLASSVAGETSTMTVKVGDEVPAVTMKELVTGAAGPVDVNLSEICAGKKVAIFGVPGAFTPGCSKSHLPSFMTAQDDLKSKGVDLTICVATNDAYVMEAWGSTSGGADAGIRFFSDANGDLTKALGLEMDTPTMLRTKRFSLIAEGNVVTHYFSSEKESSDTWAPAVLAAL